MRYLFWFVILPGLIVTAFLWGRMYEMTRQKMQPPESRTYKVTPLA